jgi:hypothetical protein
MALLYSFEIWEQSRLAQTLGKASRNGKAKERLWAELSSCATV